MVLDTSGMKNLILIKFLSGYFLRLMMMFRIRGPGVQFHWQSCFPSMREALSLIPRTAQYSVVVHVMILAILR